MATREEIREGIHDIIGDCLIKIGCGEGGCPKAERLETEAQETCIQSLLDYLHSQGVVIKVERELPDWLMEGQIAFSTEDIAKRFEQAGYVATVPLIAND